MSKMNKAMIAALAEYGKAVLAKGWKAGEPIIRKHLEAFPDFDKFAMAMRLMMRADELLDEQKRKRGVK